MENNYVDITKKSVVTAVEWFHGYGGNALGLKRVIPGLRSVAVCERDAFVVANMVSKMEKGLLDAVPIWTDVTDFPTEPFGCGILDLFVASYPCQGFSHAGKRLGVDDHRHLWPHCRRFINGARPGWVWLENVEGHVTLGLSTVLADLEEDGYTAAWGIFSASEVGAPHQRKRVFILAHRADDNGRGRIGGTQTGVGPDGIGRRGFTSGGEELALGNSIGRPHGEPEINTAEAGVNAHRNPAASGGEDVANEFHEGLQGHAGDVNREGREPGGETGPVAEGGLPGGGEDVAHDRSSGCENGIPEPGQRESGHTEEPGNNSQVWPSRPGASQYGWEPPRVVGNAGLQRQAVGCLQTAGVEQSNEEVISELRELGYHITPCAECQREGLDRYNVVFGGQGSGTCSTFEGMRGVLAEAREDGAYGTSGDLDDAKRRPLRDNDGANTGQVNAIEGSNIARNETDGQTQPPMGGNADGPAAGLDFPRCTGLTDTELEEVYGWMVKGTNRTDELRLCGNGVVPQTAEKAWRILYAELCAGKSGNNQIQSDESERKKEANEPGGDGILFKEGAIGSRVCPPQERKQDGQQNRELGDNKSGRSREEASSSVPPIEGVRVVQRPIYAAQDQAQEGKGMLSSVQQQSAVNVGEENKKCEVAPRPQKELSESSTLSYAEIEKLNGNL